MPAFFYRSGPEIWGLLGCTLLLAGYELFRWTKVRRDRFYTVQGVNAAARAAWVHSIMTLQGKDILGWYW